MTDKGKQTSSLNSLFAAIGAIIAAFPGLSQFKKIDMLPAYWNNGNLIAGVVTSVLGFMVVVIFYIYRNDLKNTSRKVIVKTAIILFSGFLFAIIVFSLLDSFCRFQDKDKHEAFIPIVLDSYLSERLSSPHIHTRAHWVELDGALAVNDQIDASDGGSKFLNITMAIFLLLYLLIFTLLIASVLVLGFHVAPEISFSAEHNVNSKDGESKTA